MAATATAPREGGGVCEQQVHEWRERRPSAAGAAGGGTLARLLGSAHAELAAASATACPVCGGTMKPHGLGGRCDDCGSSLA